MSERAERIHFGSIKEGIEPPNLIEVQLNSYVDFLQKDVAFNKRKNYGLQAVFKEVFPIQSYDEKATLDFSHYEIGEPKLTALEAQREGQTYSAPLHVTFQLKEEKGTKEEKVYMGEIPLMTAQGTFVINGAERVVVSQLHRSPGIAFESSVHLNGKVLYSFRIIPDRGSWIEVQFDTADLLYIYLDRRKRRRKFLATTFLRALGYGSDEEVIKLFYNIETLKLSEKLDEEMLATKVLTAEVRDGEVTVARAFEPLTLATVRQIMALGTKEVKVAMLGESAADLKAAPVYKKHKDVQTTILAGAGEVQFHLKASGTTQAEAQEKVDRLANEIEDVLEDAVFSSTGESLEQIVGYYLQMRGQTLATAESCTGGLLAERLTSVSGSSRYYLGGAVVYNNDLKKAFADVPPLMIAEHGAVSKEVAIALAEGIRKKCKSSLGIGITGVAGPTGGTEAKPVGLVYIALADGTNKTEVVERKFLGDRDRIRHWASQQALDMVRRKLI